MVVAPCVVPIVLVNKQEDIALMAWLSTLRRQPLTVYSVKALQLLEFYSSGIVCCVAVVRELHRLLEAWAPGTAGCAAH